MGVITVAENGTFGQAHYVAVPLNPSLTELIERSDLKPDFFELIEGPKVVQSRKAVLANEDSIADITATFSTEPFFKPEFYNLKGLNLDGYTTFHVSGVGTSKQLTEEYAQRVLSLFSDVVELPIRDNIRSMLDQVMKSSVVTKFNNEMRYFEYLQKARINIKNSVRLPNKEIRAGIMIDLMKMRLVNQHLVRNTFPNGYNVTLVDRTQGDFWGMPIETSLVYMSGIGIKQGFYGMQLTRQHEEYCPESERHFCDQARAVAGLLLTQKEMFYGGNLLMTREEMEALGAKTEGATGYCAKLITTEKISEKREVVLEGVEGMNQAAGQIKKVIPDIQIKEMKVLANIVYNATHNYTA